MAHTKLYAGIFVVLFVASTTQVAIEFAGLLDDYYWTALAVILVLSTVKSVLVAAYYQHLRWEPPALSYLILTGLLAAIALTIAASYSIT